ncbi:hypothetical protein Tco_1536862 [Tanacetum coccineum]
MSREVGYGIEDIWDDMVGDMEERAPTIIEGLSHRVTDLSTTLARDTHGIYINEDSSCDIGGLDSLLQTQLTATFGRIQTLEARDPIRTNDPEDAGSSS